jgi:hypothetical protein
MQREILRLTSAGGFSPMSREQLGHLRERLDSFGREYRARKHASRILQRLTFVEIGRRWSRIPNAEKSTNSWLFKDRKTGFLKWLRAGSGIYWITGKVW